MGAFAYILRCADGSLYVGSATGEDVGPRVDQHNAGAFPGSYTWSRRPVTLIWCEYSHESRTRLRPSDGSKDGAAPRDSHWQMVIGRVYGGRRSGAPDAIAFE